MAQIIEGEPIAIRATHSFVDPKSGAEFMLNEMVSGSFQWGTGRDARIVSELDEVCMFSPHIQARVKTWLEKNGHRQAYQDRIHADIQAKAESEPGSIDARLAALEPQFPGLRAELIATIDEVLVKTGVVKDPSNRGMQANADGAQTNERRLGGKLTELSNEELRIMQRQGYHVTPGSAPRSFDPQVTGEEADVVEESLTL